MPSQLQGTGCEIKIHYQPPGLMGLQRLERIRHVRTAQQRGVWARERPPLVVVNVDLDELSLPNAGQVQSQVARVAAGHWDVICANGWMHMWSYQQLGSYDSFASILNNGHWLYPEAMGGQVRALQVLHANVMRSAEPYSMRACFGGMAIYRFDGVWDGGAGATCDYKHIPNNYRGYTREVHNGWCEHVGFMECIRAQRHGDLRVGISRDLPVHWSSDGNHANNYHRRTLQYFPTNFYNFSRM